MQRYSNTVVLQGPFRAPECFVVRAHDDKVSFWKFVCYLAVHCGPMLYCHLYFWQLPSFSESIQVGHGRYGPSKQTAARRNSWQTSHGLDQQWTPLRSPPLSPEPPVGLYRHFPSRASPVLLPLPGEAVTHTPSRFAPLVSFGILLLPDALMCAPSINTILGSTIRLCSALFGICSKIPLLNSETNRSRNKQLTVAKRGISPNKLYLRNHSMPHLPGFPDTFSAVMGL